MVDRLVWLVGWSCVVYRLVWFVGIVTGSSFVCNFHNISGITISSVVLDNLDATIGKKYSVFSGSGISITGFACSEINL